MTRWFYAEYNIGAMWRDVKELKAIITEKNSTKQSRDPMKQMIKYTNIFDCSDFSSHTVTDSVTS